MDIKKTKTTEKVWGFEEGIVNNGQYCGKLMHVKKGYQCSLHYHSVKHETFYLLKGSIELELEDDKKILEPGDVVVVGKYMKHRFTGLGDDNVIIEISTKDLPFDSHRIEQSRKVENNV